MKPVEIQIIDHLRALALPTRTQPGFGEDFARLYIKIEIVFRTLGAYSRAWIDVTAAGPLFTLYLIALVAG